MQELEFARALRSKVTVTDPRTQNASPWHCAGICLWFGAIAGLCERVLYHFFPGPLGPDDLWWAAFADLLFFTVLAVACLVLATVLRRMNFEGLAFFLASSLLLVDCLSIAIPAPGHALVHSVTAGLLALAFTLAFLKFRSPILRLGYLTLPLLALYLAVYLGLLPLLSSRDGLRASGKATAPGSNVLLIIVDTLAADHLSTYGYQRPTSPNLTALASQGVFFENAVAPSSWTLPSHASMFTGRYASEHHAGQNDWRLDERFPTIAEAFRKNGYRTAGFSANPYLFTRRNGLDRGYQHFEECTFLEHLFMTNIGRRMQNRLILVHLLPDVIGRCGAETISRDALSWILRDSGKPFFVTINYFDVHEPFMPPAVYLHRFSKLERPMNQSYWPPDVQLTPAQLKDTVDSYDAAIAFIDDKMAGLLADLKEHDQLENTIVLITSDHGESFQQHGFMFHGKGLYWDLIHVPLVVYGPGRVPAGVRIQRPVSLLSLPSTLLDLAGIKAQGQFDDHSLVALWRTPGAQTAWPYPVSELAGFGESPRFPSYYGPMRSVVTPDWHFIEGGQRGKELYPCCSPELDDRATTPEGQKVSLAFRRTLDDEDGLTVTPRALSTLLYSSEKEIGRIPPEPKFDQRERRKMNDLLHALGYLP